MFDMFEVRFWAKMWCSEVFEVRSCCNVTRLVLELTVWCSQTVQFFVMFDMFEVRFWAKMWCSESSMFRHSMFGVFKVRYFGVCSKTTIYHLIWSDIYLVHFGINSNVGSSEGKSKIKLTLLKIQSSRHIIITRFFSSYDLWTVPHALKLQFFSGLMLTFLARLFLPTWL